jgi:TetR/AcrR family transcriptional regulator, fatty acid biosynthesis regulator
MVAKPLVMQDVSAPNGKQRLIAAALRLGARGASVTGLGLRELAREAGLNHNTFYRHFRDADELGHAVAETVAAQIMEGMKEVRRNAVKHADANRGAAEYFLDYVRRNPDPFVIGARELHSSGTAMRRVMQDVLEQIALQSVEQIIEMGLAPGLEPATLARATRAITYAMLCRALDYLEQPGQRARIADELTEFMRMQFLGAVALQRG